MEEVGAGPAPPRALAPPSCCRAGHRPVGDEAAEVVDARQVDELERAAEALDPPAVAVGAHRGPVVERVAPELARLRERVGRDAGDRALAGRAPGARRGRRFRRRRRSACRRRCARRARPRGRAAPATRARSAPDRRASPPCASPVVDPVRVALPERTRVPRRHRRVRIGEQRGRARERRRRHVGRAGDPFGRPERQNLPPCLARSREPVDEAIRVLVEYPVRQRGRMEQDSGGALEVHAFRTYRRLRISRRMPLPKTPQPRAFRSRRVEPIVDCGRYAVKRTVGEPVAVYATVIKDGHDMLARRGALQGAGRAKPWQRGAAAGLRRGSLGRRRSRRPAGALAVPGRRVDRPHRDVAGRRSAARSRPARRTSQASCPRARMLFGRERDRRGRSRVGGGRPPRRGDLARPSRSTSTACSRASARGTSSSRARWAGSAASRRCCRSSPSSASTSSTCRRSTRSATRTGRAGTTRSTPGPDDLGSPWAIGSEEGGHNAIHPDLGTWDDFDAMVAAAKAADSSSRSTSRSSARPTIRG